MKIAIVSSSLNPNSRSRLMARLLAAKFQAAEDVEVDLIDLQELALPFCDGGAAYGDANAVELNHRLGQADACVLATSIYNFSVNAAMKNVVELAGRQMAEKLVGFICSAGGSLSYMSVMAFANSLMLDYRVIVLPRFVFATGGDWDVDVLKMGIQTRLEQFEGDFLKLARKLAD